MQVIQYNGTAMQFSAVTNVSGKVTGSKLCFTTKGAKSLKEEFKRQGLTNKQASKKANEVLRGETTEAWAKFEATISVARSGGFMPMEVKLNKAGTKLTPVLELDPEFGAKQEAEKLQKELAQARAELAAARKQLGLE